MVPASLTPLAPKFPCALYRGLSAAMDTMAPLNVRLEACPCGWFALGAVPDPYSATSSRVDVARVLGVLASQTECGGENNVDSSVWACGARPHRWRHGVRWNCACATGGSNGPDISLELRRAGRLWPLTALSVTALANMCPGPTEPPAYCRSLRGAPADLLPRTVTSEKSCSRGASPAEARSHPSGASPSNKVAKPVPADGRASGCSCRHPCTRSSIKHGNGDDLNTG
mmetsp:Transcript_18959/g.41890  ORF Transcript_18959/g.41890 Transcript_18959/m.41890 type:complete len:228 (+) Transcript_18959:336-1019(+)